METRTYNVRGDQQRKVPATQRHTERLEDGRISRESRDTAGTLVARDLLSEAEAKLMAAELLEAAAPAPTPDPTPDPTPTPTPTPTPGGPWAWDAKAAKVDPDAALTQGFRANLPNAGLAMLAYGVATAEAGSVDRTIQLQHPIPDGSTKINFRIPDGAKGTTGSDHHLSVIDRERGTILDLWQPVFDTALNRVVSAGGGRVMKIGDVNYPRGWGGCASCTPLRAGLVTPEDLKKAIDANGKLPYTLQYGAPNVRQGSPRYPATANAPTNNNSGTVEGTWVGGDPSYDIEGSAMKPFEKVLARTVVAHGMCNRDNGGAFAIYAKDPQTNHDGAQWSLVGLSGNEVGFSAAFKDFLSKCRVLVPPTA